MTAPEALRAAGRPPSAVDAPQHATTERLGGPEPQLSPAGRSEAPNARRRELTVSELFGSALTAESERELELVLSLWLSHGYTPLEPMPIVVGVDVPPYAGLRRPRTFAELVAAKRADLRKRP